MDKPPDPYVSSMARNRYRLSVEKEKKEKEKNAPNPWVYPTLFTLFFGALWLLAKIFR